MPKITPEGGAPTHAYPDAAYHPEPPASIPDARSHVSGALSAHASGHDAAGTAAVDRCGADCRSDCAGPGDPCPRGRDFCEASNCPGTHAGSRATGAQGLTDDQRVAPGGDSHHHRDALSVRGASESARAPTAQAREKWDGVLPGP